MKIIESVAHVLMGFGAGLLNLRLLLTKRELDQLPPENDKNPVLWVDTDIRGKDWDWIKAWLGPAYGGAEYWSKERVMDTLRDSREYDIGATIAWFFILAAGVAIGHYLT